MYGAPILEMLTQDAEFELYFLVLVRRQLASCCKLTLALRLLLLVLESQQAGPVWSKSPLSHGLQLDLSVPESETRQVSFGSYSVEVIFSAPLVKL